MCVHKILVPLLDSTNDALDLEVGLVLSKSFDAHMQACFVRPDPDDAVPYTGIGGRSAGMEKVEADFRRHSEETGKRAARRAHRLFDKACRKSGVPKVRRPAGPGSTSAQWREVVGRATHIVPNMAKLADLTVFGGPQEEFHLVSPSVLEHTLLESGCPLLLVPKGVSASAPKKIAIAWDASVPAIRAVRAALPFMRKAARIEILSVKETYSETADPNELACYLASRGLTSECRILEQEREEVAHALLAAAQEDVESMLVMGGYAHNRFGEIIFGGTTLCAIKKSKVLLLLTH